MEEFGENLKMFLMFFNSIQTMMNMMNKIIKHDVSRYEVLYIIIIT